MKHFFLIVSVLFIKCNASEKKDISLLNLNYVENVQYSAGNSWKDGFSGHIEFTLTRTVFYWTISFIFQGLLSDLRFYNGDIQSTSAGSGTSEFYFKNKEYNGRLEKGSTQKFDFMGLFPADGSDNPTIPPVEIWFRGKVIYREGGSIRTTLSPEVSRRTTDMQYVLDLIRNNKMPTLPTTTRTTTKRTTTTTEATTTTTEVLDEDIVSTVESSVASKEHQEVCNTLIKVMLSANISISPSLLQNCKKKLDVNGTLTSNSTSIGNSTEVKTTTKLKTKSTTLKTTTTSKPKTQPAFWGPFQYKNLNLGTKYSYEHALHLSSMFFEAQKSGRLPKDNRIKWRGNSALRDKADGGQSLVGGFYDAGDTIKFGFPMAFSMTMLAWSGIEFFDVYKQTEEIQFLMKNLVWGSHYITKCHTSKYEFYAQVGDPEKEHKDWDRPEDVPHNRPAFKLTSEKPGSDLVFEASAALYATSILFNKLYNRTTEYEEMLKKHATELMEFGETYQGLYHFAVPLAKDWYKSTGYRDEYVWAKLWQYRATGNKTYYDKAIGMYYNWGLFKQSNKWFSWDDKTNGIQMLIAQIGNQHKKGAEETIENYCKSLNVKERKTKKGLLFLNEWAPLRYSANAAFICVMAALEGVNFEENIAFSTEQLEYMLGSSGRSYVVGFGKNYPKRPHHRGSTCPNVKQRCSWDVFNSKNPNHNVLYGALVGGPNNQDVFDDDRRNFKQSEVALDYNAGFQGLVTGVLQNAIYSKLGLKNEEKKTKTIMKRSSEAWYKHYEEYIEAYNEENNIDTDSPANSTHNFFVILLVTFLTTLGQFL